MSEDLEILRERHPNAHISDDIPDSWILIVDEMLCRLRYANLSYINISVCLDALIVGIPVDEYERLPFYDIINSAQYKIEKLKEIDDLEK